MKIHQLPIGARFEYEGQEYVKTGPLSAAGKQGQRLIPKYAVLKPLDGPASAVQSAKAGSIPREAVIAAFETFYAECRNRVATEHLPELTTARERFLKALD